MKHLTLEELYQRAKTAFDKSGLTQTDMGERISQPRSHMSRALKEPIRKGATIYVAIIKDLTGKTYELLEVWREA